MSDVDLLGFVCPVPSITASSWEQAQKISPQDVRTLWVRASALASCLRTGKCSYRRQVCEGKASLQSILHGGVSRELP
ncbi:hypothetical protein ACRRTK_000157 [Alexandromys fortis]